MWWMCYEAQGTLYFFFSFFNFLTTKNLGKQISGLAQMKYRCLIVDIIA
jgi:hypothetical protein